MSIILQAYDKLFKLLKNIRKLIIFNNLKNINILEIYKDDI